MIEVKAPVGDRAVEAATAKGRELGCWALIEQTVFVQLQQASWNAFGARAILVHGPGPHVTHVTPPSSITEFHCVVPSEDVKRA